MTIAHHANSGCCANAWTWSLRLQVEPGHVDSEKFSNPQRSSEIPLGIDNNLTSGNVDSEGNAIAVDRGQSCAIAQNREIQRQPTTFSQWRTTFFSFVDDVSLEIRRLAVKAVAALVYALAVCSLAALVAWAQRHPVQIKIQPKTSADGRALDYESWERGTSTKSTLPK